MLELRERAESVLSSYGIDIDKYYVGILGSKGYLRLLSLCGKTILSFKVMVDSRLTKASRNYLVDKVVPTILDKYKKDVLEVIRLKEEINAFPNYTKLPTGVKAASVRNNRFIEVTVPRMTVSDGVNIRLELMYVAKTKTLELYTFDVGVSHNLEEEIEYNSKEVLKEVMKYTKNKTILKHCEEVSTKTGLQVAYNRLVAKLTICDV
jgi:hypothetical protein